MSVEKIISEQNQQRKAALSRRWFAILILFNVLLIGYLVYQFITLIN